MPDPATRRAVWWLFGAEGLVATESGMQVVVAATAMGVAGVYVMRPIMSALTDPFGVTDARIGIIITTYTAPSVVLVPVVGLLADRFGRRRLLIAELLLFGDGGAAVALTTEFTAIIALRLIQGIGFAAINPLGVTIIGDYFEGRREATAQGLRVVGIQTMALVSPPLAGRLVVGAWQYPFLTGAMLRAPADLLAGRPAPTHHVVHDDLAAVTERVDARVVDTGDALTAAGVTAGIDLSLDRRAGVRSGTRRRRGPAARVRPTGIRPSSPSVRPVSEPATPERHCGGERPTSETLG